jgi:REP element-mobilizing transposase RayT
VTVPQSFTCLHYHLVNSTKHREPLITPDLRTRLYEYLGGLVRAEGRMLLAAGGMPDHVHLLARLGQAKSVADVLRVVKTNSSRWVHETFPAAAGFGWQTGYGAFPVGQSTLASVQAIHRQPGATPHGAVVPGRVPRLPAGAWTRLG